MSRGFCVFDLKKMASDRFYELLAIYLGSGHSDYLVAARVSTLILTQMVYPSRWDGVTNLNCLGVSDPLMELIADTLTVRHGMRVL
jgi:hypothetical protein